MLTKKTLSFMSGLASAILLILNQIGTFRLCGGIEYGRCMDILSSGMIVFFPILALFGFSLVMYFIRDDIFRSWIKFVYVWIPLSMFMILIAPEYGNALFPIVKGTVAVFFSGLFIFISLGIITWKYITTRKV